MNKILITLFLSLATQTAFAETMSCKPNSSSYNCLVCNCYHETRGEPKVGMIAVAKTVLSRAQSDEFPDTVCGVVYQPSQFSWTADSYSNNINAKEPKDIQALQDCKAAADTAIDEGANGLLYFYNPRKVTPGWSRRVTSCGRAGNHVFSVSRGDTCPRHLGAAANTGTQQQKKSSGGGSAR